MTTQTYRRARHSVSLLHAHLVCVTNYRRPMFTDAMLVHLRVAYPPTGHLWSPSHFAVSCSGAPPSIITQYIDRQARPPSRPRYARQ